MRERVRVYNEELNQNINGASKYLNEEDGYDFITDDVALPIGHQENEGGYFGLENMPDIDEVIESENARVDADSYDKFVGVDVILPNSADQKLMARVRRKVKSDNRNDVKFYNTLKDHSVYEVVIPDVTIDEVEANLIAECIVSECDPEGRQYRLLREISDHRKNADALNVADGSYRARTGNPVPKRTTRDWKLLLEWIDGSMDWVELSEVKESYPIQLAEYAVANGISHEPAFNWWVHKVLKRKNRLIKKVRSKYWRTTHKFGIVIPKSVERAYEIDRVTGTSHWTRAIEKEMRNVRIAFEKLDNVSEEQIRTGKVRPGYSHCSTQIIFDIKMDGKLTRKARLVADGHKTHPPSSITYSSVVSRDSVRVALNIASLNSLHVSACDIGNAYLNATCREKSWTIAGPEFGSDKGSTMIITRALYGLKSSGAAWRSTLATTMEKLGYRPTQADPDVWIKRASKQDGSPYYKCICRRCIAYSRRSRGGYGETWPGVQIKRWCRPAR